MERKLNIVVMSDDQDSDTDATVPMDVVWVKVEVDEDGVVNGLDDGNENQNAEDPTEHSQIPTGMDLSLKGIQSNLKRKRKSQPRTLHLKCDYCDYRTSYKNSLNFHILKHTNPEPLSCDQCEYTTRYPCSLRRHMIGQHKVNSNTGEEIPSFKCTECEYTSMFKSNLAAHLRKHATEKRFKCDQCSFSSAYRNNFLKHSKTHKVNYTMYQCDRCTFTTRHEGHIARHLAQIHKIISTKAHKCDHCPFSTTVRWRLSIHKSRSHQSAPLKCEYCNFSTEFNCAFKIHKLTHVGRKSRVTETDIYIPNEDFVPAVELSEPNEDKNDAEANLTLNVNLPKNNLAVATMGKTEFLIDTEDKTSNWRSIEVKECPGNEKPFKCTQCNYISKYKASVQRHFQRQHTGDASKPYKCMHCDFSTKTKDQISLHNKRSNSGTLLTCKFCDFTTLFKCQKVMHQKVHCPYKCKFCSYTCKGKGDIQRHYSSTHQGNMFKCQYCDYTAARKDSLACHESTHTGAKPFQCNFCEYATVRQCVLDTHVRKYHPEHYMVTIIDYSKIQSLRIEKKIEEYNNDDIVESNPLFQSFCNKNDAGNHSANENEFLNKFVRESRDILSKLQASMFENESEKCVTSNSKPSDFEAELQKCYDLETTVEVNSV